MPCRFRTAAMVALGLAVAPALAFAQTTQLRLSWDHCAAEGYVGDRSFACNTNTGEDVLVASAVLGDEVPHTTIAAFEAFIDIRPTSQILPMWWQVLPGQCRPNALGLQAAGLIASPLCTPWYLADGANTQEPLTVSQHEYGNDGAIGQRDFGRQSGPLPERRRRKAEQARAQHIEQCRHPEQAAKHCRRKHGST